MARTAPVCPYPHAERVRSKVLALQISSRDRSRMIGGLRLKPRVVHGVDIHCPSCHFESWVEMVDGWRIEGWDGPTQCSCGETTERERLRGDSHR
jgi:hypothetical protein